MASEFQLIDRFTSAFALEGRGVVAGPGDDCALTRPSPGHLLVSKVDQVVEGVHFTAAFRPEEIGHKALAVSLSDLAAAGAAPRWFLVAIAMRDGITSAFVARMGKGMARLATASGATLIGGNFTSAAQLSVSVTALGEVRPEHALQRSGARPGDRLFVSGVLGEAALGVRVLAEGRPTRPSRAVRAQLAPEPRVRLGSVIGRYASAAVDVSDGLLQDLGHLCKRSGVGAQLHIEDLPLGTEVAALGADGLGFALAGGEDYELLFAVPPSRVAALRRAAARLGERITEIGEVQEAPGIRGVDREGGSVALPKRGGWEHVARRPRQG